MTRQRGDLERQLAGAVLEMTSPAVPSMEVDRMTARLLSKVVPSDNVLLTQVDLAGEGTVVLRGHELIKDLPASATLARVGRLHPAVCSYLVPGDDRRPRRVTDVTSLSAWLASPAYAELFSFYRERFQLSIVTRLSPTVGLGWVLTRTTRDFNDDDIEVAQYLFPSLVALAAMVQVRSTRSQAPDALGVLSARERVVLELLATGGTAAAIGRALGISETTVRKHLQNLYRKLGVSDRVSAVGVLRG